MFEAFPSDSPVVEEVWRSESDRVTPFISQAISRWEIVIWRHRGKARVSVRGPETRASRAASHEGAEYVGVQFRLGTYMPRLPTAARVDGEVVLPGAGGGSVWLLDEAWPVPDVDPEDAEAFADRLARRGLLARDPLIQGILAGEAGAHSARTLHRRFVRAVGLGPKTVQQIERARHATRLLERGVPIADAVFQAGYADQPHLTRSLRRFLGATPGAIARRATHRDPTDGDDGVP